MTTFLEYMRQIEREAEAAGPDAVAQLRTLQLHWRAELAALRDECAKPCVHDRDVIKYSAAMRTFWCMRCGAVLHNRVGWEVPKR